VNIRDGAEMRRKERRNTKEYRIHAEKRRHR